LSEIFLFLGHQYFDYGYGPLKLFGPGLDYSYTI